MNDLKWLILPFFYHYRLLFPFAASLRRNPAKKTLHVLLLRYSAMSVWVPIAFLKGNLLRPVPLPAAPAYLTERRLARGCAARQGGFTATITVALLGRNAEALSFPLDDYRQSSLRLCFVEL